jgi:tripartite-type tricarboxylate transporter receptor subunit TctC
LPDDIVDKLNKSVIEAVAAPDIQERFRRDGFIAQKMSPAEFTQFVAAEDNKWKAVIQRAGLAGKPQ